MATLKYNNFDFGSSIRTMNYEVEPLYDDSGADWIGSRVRIDVVFVVNPYLIATNRPTPGMLPGNTGEGGAGDRMGLSIGKMRDVLGQPRRILEYGVGRDTVIISPAQAPGAKPRFNSDIGTGPHPRPLRFTTFSGDHTAVGHWGVETDVSYCKNALLSNRWSIQSTCDEHFVTTRVITGKAIFRKDFLDEDKVQPDNFRRFLIVPVGFRMRRQSVDVVQNAEGTEVAYTVVDREVPYGLGPTSGISRIECGVTAGAEVALKSKNDHARAGGELAGNLLNLNIGGVWRQFWANEVAQPRATALVRVYGIIGTPRNVLAAVAAAVAVDRLYPVFDTSGNNWLSKLLDPNKPRIVSAYMTLDWSSDGVPFVEYRGEYMVPLNKTGGLMKGGAIDALFNMTPEIKGGLLPGLQDYKQLNYGPAVTATPPPSSAGTRGTWVGQLVAQALAGSDCSLPADPPAYKPLATEPGRIY